MTREAVAAGSNSRFNPVHEIPGTSSTRAGINESQNQWTRAVFQNNRPGAPSPPAAASSAAGRPA
jgi:hypothetical protein